MMDGSKAIATAALLFALANPNPAEAAKCRGVKCIVIGVTVEQAIDKAIDVLEKIRERQRARKRLRECLPSHDCTLSGQACRMPPTPARCVTAAAGYGAIFS